MPINNHPTNNTPSPFRFSNRTPAPERSSNHDSSTPTSAQPFQHEEATQGNQFARAPKFATRLIRGEPTILTLRKSVENVNAGDHGGVYQPDIRIRPPRQQQRSPSPKRPRLAAPLVPLPEQPNPIITSHEILPRQTPHFASAPRFALPSSSQVPKTPTSGRHQPFLPFLPPPPPFSSTQDTGDSTEAENIYLLPDAFSPHRRKERFIPGGCASLVRGWLVEASASSNTTTTIPILVPGHPTPTSSPPLAPATDLTLTFHPDTGLLVRVEHVLCTTPPTASTTTTPPSIDESGIHLLRVSVQDPSAPTTSIQTSASLANSKRTFHVLLPGAPTPTSTRVVSGIGAAAEASGVGEGGRGLSEGLYVRLCAPVWKMVLPISLLGVGGVGVTGPDSRGGGEVEWVVCARWSVL